MAIREEAQQQSIHQIFLPNYNVTDLLAESRNPLAQLPNFLCNFLRRFHTVSSDTHARENVRSNVPQRADFLLISLANPLLTSRPFPRERVAGTILNVRSRCSFSNHGIERFG